MAWFDENPDFLQEEEEALAEEFQYEIDKAARSSGRLIIKVLYPIGETKHELTCVYPVTYPFFAPKIFGPTIPPGRHRDPYSHLLCTLENEQSAWNSRTDNLAKILKEKIPEILQAHASPENASDLEGNVGYQVTGQINYEDNSVIFVDDWNLPEGAEFGEMTLKVHNTDYGIEKNKPIKAIQGYIETLQSQDHFLIKAESPLNSIYKTKLMCKWVKLDAPPASIQEDKILNEAIQKYPAIKNMNFQNKGVDIVGLVFPEEDVYKRIVLNWLFVARRKLPKKLARNGNPHHLTRIIRSDRYTKDNFSRRIPRLAPISEKKALIIGAGALGSHIAWQLARAEISSLSLIDSDIVQAGNLPRWLLGFWAVGRSKVEVLSDFLLKSFPGLICTPIKMHIGNDQAVIFNNKEIDAHDFIKELIRKSDITIDATAETNVSNYISQTCDQLRTPYVWATATEGGWGGIVGRAIPETTDGNWLDFSHHYKIGSFNPPPAEEGSTIQPIGCFHPTFTGTGFDLDHISIMAARLAIATLCNNEQKGYPNFDWDYAVLHLWDEKTKTPVAPYWETRKLTEYTGNKE